MSAFASLVPEEALLIDVVQEASARHLHIISNGTRTALSPIVPDGWHRLVVTIRTPSSAGLSVATN